MADINKQFLTLPKEEMKEFGYKVIDTLVDHFDSLNEKKATTCLTRKELEEKLKEEAPVKGSDKYEVLNKLSTDVFKNIMHLDHPRFFAFVPSPSNFISVMAEALASGFNVFAGTWLEASGPAEIELTTIDWLRKIYSMPETAGGLFVTGGSAANLTALVTARNVMLNNNFENAVIYCSDQTHSSIERGLKIIGFKPEQLKKINSISDYTINLGGLKNEINKNRAKGLTPFCIIANAGTTNTGSVDPIDELADICEKENLWLHVDGAYGAPAILVEDEKTLFQGIERAHSLSLDPHKWLFQPYEIGCLLVRNKNWLKDTFTIMPEYLQDIERDSELEEINYCNYGIQLTRSLKALKLWMSLKVFGLEEFSKAIEHGIKLAETAEEYISKFENLQIIVKANLGVINFRVIKNGMNEEKINQLNSEISKKIIESGFAMITTTTLNKKIVLRLCTINPRTSDKDIYKTIDKIRGFIV